MVGLALLAAFSPTTLTVGDGRTYSQIVDAVAAAKTGDTIAVYRKVEGYLGTAVLIRKAGLKIVGMESPRIILDGGSFEYSGAGSVPRAIFQVDPGSDGVTIENFELRGAHNLSFNGAGVRINAANRVTIRNCEIHSNDMGIMSNGIAGNPHAGEDQLIENCSIHENGNLKDPGYNHNLYLGGTSVTVRFCDIYRSLTGHNLKSRAHFTLVEYSHIHDSSNRELDFVEAWDTERPNSNAVLLGNLIEKDPHCPGNRVTIHFGREKGERDGSLFLLHNTVTTPFLSGVVSLSTGKASCRLENNDIRNTAQSRPHLVDVSAGGMLSSVAGGKNLIGKGYDLAGTSLRTEWTFDRYLGKSELPSGMTPIPATYRDGDGKAIPAQPKFQWSGTGSWNPARGLVFGAGP